MNKSKSSASLPQSRFLTSRYEKEKIEVPEVQIQSGSENEEETQTNLVIEKGKYNSDQLSMAQLVEKTLDKNRDKITPSPDKKYFVVQLDQLREKMSGFSSLQQSEQTSARKPITQSEIKEIVETPI